MLLVELQQMVTHLQVAGPTAELEAGSKKHVETVDHGGVGGWQQGGMEEVEDVGHGRTQAFDFQSVEVVNGPQDLLFARGVEDGFQKLAKSDFVLGVFIDVGDAQFWLPVEGVGGPFENLFLLRDGGQHAF